MKSQYQWLKDEQTRLRKQGKGSWRDDLSKLAVLGEGSQRSQLMGNTGYGEDGQLQPNMPTGIVHTTKGPQMLHEGENAIRNRDGSVTIVPAGPSQSQLLEIEQRTKMPGMQTGGTYDPLKPETWTSPQEALKGSVAMGWNTNTAKTGTLTPAFANQPQQDPKMGSLLQSGTVSPTAGTQQYGMGGRDFSFKPAYTTTSRPEPLVVAPPQFKPTTTTSTPTTGVDANGNPIGGSQVAYVAPPQFKPTTTTSTPEPETPPPPPPTPDTQFGGGYWGRGMQRLERYAEGRGPYDEQIYNQAMGQFKGEEAAARGALEQQMAQAGITGREAGTERYMAGLGIGAEESQFMANLRKEQADRAFQAAQGIPSQALAGAAFDFMKQKYGDEAFLRMSNDIKSGMTYDQAVAKYPGLTQDDYNGIRNTVLGPQLTEQRQKAETDLAGYFQAAYTTPGYDWRNDPTATTALQRVWEAQGNTGQFTEDWADRQFAIATQSPGARFIRSIMSDPNGWYAQLPETTVRDEKGNVIEWGKDEMGPAVARLAGMLTLGGAVFGQDAGGHAILVDPVTGDPIGGGGGAVTAGGTTAPTTYNPADPTSVTSAIRAFTVGSTAVGALLDGVTPNAMRQYLTSHGGLIPTSEEDWTTWSETERVYDIANPDDVDAAIDYFTMNNSVANAGIIPNPDMIKLWLAQNGGKIGSVNDFIQWAPTHAGSTSGISMFIAGQSTTLGAPDNALMGRIMSAQDLMSRKTELGAGFEAAYKAADFTSAAEVEATAGLYNFSMAGDIANSNLQNYATENAGKIIVIDGKPYYINSIAPLTTIQTFTVDPESTHAIRVQGITVYNPESKEWKCYIPPNYVYNGHPVPSGFYDIDRDLVANEVFANSY